VRTRSIRLAGMALAAAAMASVPVQAQVKAGPEFRANTYTTGTQRNPGLAAQANGDFIVTWSSSLGDGAGYGVFGQRYVRDGSPKGGEFLINSFTTGNQAFTDLSIAPSGGFVVVWQGAAPGGATIIEGQVFDNAGAKVGAEFQANSGTPGFEYYGHVGSDAKGNFVVTWTSAIGDGPANYGILARRFAANGTPLGASFSVNTTTASFQEVSKIATNADGSFVIVWESLNQDGSSYAVVGRRFDATGTSLGGEFIVNSYTTGNQGDPSVGAGADGRFVVGWESTMSGANGLEVRSQRYDNTGAPVGTEFIVNSYTTGSQFLYSVAVDAQGNYVMAWDDARDGASFGAFGGRLTWDNTRRGVEFQANTYTTGYQGVTNVAGDSYGNFIVAWHSDQDPPGGGRGIYVQRFGGLFPVALAVDPGGNLVWEPNETVEVRPSWRNLNGASQAFGGGLANITGPSGGTYAITDPTADYGTVPNNSTQACTDCYSVLNVITSRPVQHIDASAVETLTPDTLGQTKDWKLHIGGSFTDVPASNPFYRFIETLFHHSITSGCGGTNYCPGDSTTRAQMAVFVLIAKEGPGYLPPACTTPLFNDVPPGDPFCRFIEELSRRGVVAGCGGGNYCPNDSVTREQMAVFVLRTLDATINPPACAPPNIYNDVPETSPFCRWVEELTNRGVVAGCGGGNYCPTQVVTREQMGVFISLTFGLTLYGI
jgi:hypothetical protein